MYVVSLAHVGKYVCRQIYRHLQSLIKTNDEFLNHFCLCPLRSHQQYSKHENYRVVATRYNSYDGTITLEVSHLFYID